MYGGEKRGQKWLPLRINGGTALNEFFCGHFYKFTNVIKAPSTTIVFVINAEGAGQGLGTGNSRLSECSNI